MKNTKGLTSFETHWKNCTNVKTEWFALGVDWYHSGVHSIYKQRVTINYLPKLYNSEYTSWKGKYAESRRTLRFVQEAFIGLIPDKPLGKAKLTLTRHSSQQPDYDGLAHSFKRVIDAMVKVRILEDDNPDIIGHPEYKWSKIKPRAGCIEIEVEEICGEA